MLQKILGEAVAANNAQEGLHCVDAINGLVPFFGFHLRGENGMEAINAFQRKCPSVPIIMVSASEDRRDATMALRASILFIFLFDEG